MAERLVLGLETSCDDTAAAVLAVADGQTRVLSSIVSTQLVEHERFGGIVPELASRAHVRLIPRVIDEALSVADVSLSEISLVAATRGPGLSGALLVGLSAAKGIAFAAGVPFVAVNHMEGHLYAAALQADAPEPPMMVLLVSGGHTLLVDMAGHGRYEVVGTTVDDAAGEAFDKVARFLGLGYPGGPAIDALSAQGDPRAFQFPRPMRASGLDMSFSGLKTAVVVELRRLNDRGLDWSNADVAASFQAAVIDTLVTKLFRAADRYERQTVALGGGVAANEGLRNAVTSGASELGLRAFIPERRLCTDNAAMIALAGWRTFERQGPSPLTIGADPNLALASTLDGEGHPD